jgi:hypothetical protein
LSTVSLPEKFEDQDSGNLMLHHFAVEDGSSNHRFGFDISHDSSFFAAKDSPIVIY